MKRKSADFGNTTLITKKRFARMRVDTPEFQGWVTHVWMDEVPEPVLVSDKGAPYVVIDTGFRWLQQFPDGANHCMTTILDAEGKLVEFYIDIIHEHGLDAHGVPWYDDLYLDVAELPDGRVLLLDEDELEEALAKGVITQAQYDLAWVEARRVLDEVRKGAFSLIRLQPQHQAFFDK